MRPQRFRLKVDAPAGIALVGGERIIDAPAEEVLNLPLTLSAPAGARGKQAVTFQVERVDGKAREDVASTFFGPM